MLDLPKLLDIKLSFRPPISTCTGNIYHIAKAMSSSQPFQASSPLSAGEPRRKKSKFTYRQLSQLAVSATNCPLRVIAHVDLDAFYAQCEMIRLGVNEDQPLAVQQW